MAPVNPRSFLEHRGREAFRERLATGAGYVVPDGLLDIAAQALALRVPLLVEGEPGCGKTAFAEALAQAFELPMYYLQCMEGYGIGDMLFQWDAALQDQYVRQAVPSGMPFDQARDAVWTRDFLVLGEVLAAYERAERETFPPICVIDEIDKIDAGAEDRLLQVLARGRANVPRLRPDGIVGIRSNRDNPPIVILTSNDMLRGGKNEGVSEPLRLRCLYSWIPAPSPEEMGRIVAVRAPNAPEPLLTDVVKLLWYIAKGPGGRGFPNIRTKPSIRQAIHLLPWLMNTGVRRLDRETLHAVAGHLAKRETDLRNYHAAVDGFYAFLAVVGDIDLAIARGIAAGRRMLSDGTAKGAAQ